jgi:diguanylate cyclase (GGDEF)-like protein
MDRYGRFVRRAPGRRARLRLVAILVAVALVPTLAAAWAFLRSAESSALEKADLRLAAALVRATTVLESDAQKTAGRADQLARSPRIQRALMGRDARTLRRFARAYPGVSFTAGPVRVRATTPEVALERSVTVVRGGRTLGRVTAGVPVDDALRSQLSEAGGLAEGRVLVVRATSPLAPDGSGAGEDVELGGSEYRAVSSPPVAGGDLRLVALAPRSSVDPGQDTREGRVGLAVLATLLTVALAGYAMPPALARERVARRGLTLIGDALAATHNADALLPVILESAVDATGAAGGVLRERGVEVARTGNVELGGEPMLLTLSDAAGETVELILYPRAGGFGPDAREIGEWLAGQAGIALENARLHSIAAQQAVTDPLTQLANRRRFMEALTSELSRVERFGGPLSLVLADLDDFKRINDRFGHPAGDEVLRQTARVLTQSLREVDLPARIGGEEFAILLPETQLAGAERLAERLRGAVAALRVGASRGEPVEVTASFGVAAHREGWTDADLLRAADAALYRAKLAGKNRVASEAADPV